MNTQTSHTYSKHPVFTKILCKGNSNFELGTAICYVRLATKSKSLFYIPLPTIFHLVVVYDNDWWLPDPQTTFQNQSGSLISAQWGKSGGQGWLGY